MIGRTTFVRFLTLCWTLLQLAAPGLSAIADGQLTLDNATRPATHVEATSSESCPVVHTPDCAVCRYLSTSATDGAAPPAIQWPGVSGCDFARNAANTARSATLAIPHSRAPPVS